jgi:hypothetical protein
MTLKEHIEDEFFKALEAGAQLPSSFTITLPYDHWVAIKAEGLSVIEVEGYRMNMTREIENETATISHN